MPLLHIHFQPSACHCSLTGQHELPDNVSNTHSLNTAHPLSTNLADVSFSCESGHSYCCLTLLGGGMVSTRSEPVFAGSPHKAPGTPKKLAFLCVAAIICCYNPLLPAVSIFFVCFRATSSPTSSFSFCGGELCGRGFALCVLTNRIIHLLFDKFYTCFCCLFFALKQKHTFSFSSLVSFAKRINSVHQTAIWVFVMQAWLHASETYGFIWHLSID